jgi:tetratricopeptide (TPR) repeat protein
MSSARLVKNRLLVWLLCLGAVVVLASVAAHFARRPSSGSLPPSEAYPHLAPLFAQVLAQARTKVSEAPANDDAWRFLARLYQANRLFEQARTCYRVVASRPPGLSASDHYYLSDIAQNEGDLEAAKSELREVLAKEPTYLPARLSLATVLFKSGREAEASEIWSALLSETPNQPQASVGLARFELQQGQDVAAIQRLESLMGAHLDSVSGAALLSQVLRRHGQIERADALAQISRQKQEAAPLDPWMDALFADCYDGQTLSLRFEEQANAGQIDAALPLLDRVATLDPKSWIPHLLKGWSFARAHADRQALVQYQLALDKQGDPERIVPLVVASQMALNEPDAALTFLQEQHALHPSSIDLLRVYADLAFRLKNEGLARELLPVLLRAEPYLYSANIDLAKLLWTIDREQAVQCLERIRKAFPGDVASRGLLGQHYLEHAQPASAIAPLEEALPVAGESAAHARITGMLASAYLRLGDDALTAGHTEEALSSFEKASQLVSTNIDAYAGVAKAALPLKRYQRAADALTKLAGLQPENPTIQLSLGDVQFQNNQPVEARAHWTRALELTPAADAELREALISRIDGRVSPETLH